MKVFAVLFLFILQVNILQGVTEPQDNINTHKLNKKEVRQYEKLAEHFRTIGKYDSALFFSKQLIGNVRSKDYLDLMISHEFYCLAQYDSAMKYCDECLKTDLFERDDAYNLKGCIYRQLKSNNDSALKYFKLCEHEYHHNYYVHCNLGEVYNSLKQFDKAVEELKISIKQSPKLYFAFYDISKSYDSLGEYNYAISALQAYVSREENNPYAYLDMAYHFGTTKQYDSGIYACQKAASLAKDSEGCSYVYYETACMYSLLNEKPEAFDYFEKCLKNGYNDWKHITVDPDLIHVRNDGRFGEILARYHKY